MICMFKAILYCYLKTRHIFKSCNIYLKHERFRKQKFTLLLIDVFENFQNVS